MVQSQCIYLSTKGSDRGIFGEWALKWGDLLETTMDNPYPKSSISITS